MRIDTLYEGNSVDLIKQVEDESIHAIISDIPYGIGYDDWDVLHNNTNSALGGSSDGQNKNGALFARRGKPLNGWSEADKKIPLEYQQWVNNWAADWLRTLKPGGSVFIFAGRRFAHRAVVAMEDAGFTFKDMIAWQKNKAPHRAQHVSSIYSRRGDYENAEKWSDWRVANTRPLFEPILWFQKPYETGKTLADNVLKNEVGAWNKTVIDKYTTLVDVLPESNIIRVSEKTNDHGFHPTQKPLNLMKMLVELVTIPGQVVLDPFMGSGTTLVAANQLGRHYIGFDMEHNFVEIAEKRLHEPFQEDIL